MNIVPSEFVKMVNDIKHMATYRNYDISQIWKAIQSVQDLNQKSYLSEYHPVRACLNDALDHYQFVLNAMGDPEGYQPGDVKIFMDRAAASVDQALKIYSARMVDKTDEATKQEYGNVIYMPKDRPVPIEDAAPLPDLNIILADRDNPPAGYHDSGVAAANPRPADYQSGWELWLIRSSEPDKMYIIGRNRHPFSTRVDVDSFVREYYPYVTYYNSQLTFAQSVVNNDIPHNGYRAIKIDTAMTLYQILAAIHSDPRTASFFLSLLAEIEKNYENIKFALYMTKPASFLIRYLLNLVYILSSNKLFENQCDQLEKYVTYLRNNPNATIQNDNNLKEFADLIKDHSNKFEDIRNKIYADHDKWFDKNNQKFGKYIMPLPMKQMVVPISSNSSVDYQIDENYVGTAPYTARDIDITDIMNSARNSLSQIVVNIKNGVTSPSSIIPYLNQYVVLNKSMIKNGNSFFSDIERKNRIAAIQSSIMFENQISQMGNNPVPDYWLNNFKNFITAEFSQINKWAQTLQPRFAETQKAKFIVKPTLKQNITLVPSNVNRWNNFLVSLNNYITFLGKFKEQNILEAFNQKEIKHPFVGYENWLDIMGNYSVFMTDIPIPMLTQVDNALQEMENVYKEILSNLRRGEQINTASLKNVLYQYYVDFVKRYVIVRNYAYAFNQLNKRQKKYNAQ